MTTTDDFFAAIDAGQGDRVRSNLDADASLASARDGEGVSAVMHALYHRQRDVAEMVAGRLPALDVFEAAGLGRVDEVASIVAGQPTDGARAREHQHRERREAGRRLAARAILLGEAPEEVEDRRVEARGELVIGG